MTFYTDSHCHLDALKLDIYNGDLSKAIEAARATGVKNMLSISTSIQGFNEVKNIVETFDNIWGTVGVHPLDLDKGFTSVEQLTELSSHQKIVGLGETGLDFHYSAESKTQQTESFIMHLEAGKSCDLPVVIHTRKAKSETIELLKTYAKKEKPGVFHCFTEDIEMARQGLDLGFYISLSGIVTFKNAEKLREVARYVPDNRLLIETDSPYLAPIPYRGKPNEPRYVVEVCNFIAEQRKTNADILAQQTTDNFFALFEKATL